MKVFDTEVKGIAEVEKVTVYLNLTKNNLDSVAKAGIKIIEVTVDDLKKKNDAIVAEQGEERAYRLKRVSDLGHKVADGGKKFPQTDMVSPRLVQQDLKDLGFILADVRAEWKTSHGNGRLALEFQRTEKETVLTQSQKSYCENLLGMTYSFMHAFLNAPSTLDPTPNMTFNFLRRIGPDTPLDVKLRIGKGTFFACEA